VQRARKSENEGKKRGGKECGMKKAFNSGNNERERSLSDLSRRKQRLALKLNANIKKEL